MKKPSSYIVSLVLSVITVFVTLALMGTMVVFIHATPEKAISLAQDKQTAPMIFNELESYFKDRTSSSGIPANVYTDAISESLICDIRDQQIRDGFMFMKSGNTSDGIADLDKLDESLEQFFSSYASENGIEKDKKYDTALEKAQTSARKVVSEKCDIYKMSSLRSHGVLKKVGVIYRNLVYIIAGLFGAAAVLILLLILTCRKEKRSVLYWLGVSCLIAGAVGTIPSAILLGTGYFNSFSIKQPSVFTAYTSAMNGLTSAFMAASIAVTAVGIALLIVYGVLLSKERSVTPTDVSNVSK